LGDADLVALADGFVVHPAFGARWRVDRAALLVEVKSTAGGAYERYGPRERAQLLAAAKLAGAQAWLVWWPPRKQPVWIHSDDWPAAK
jgi:hypothetical protein